MTTPSVAELLTLSELQMAAEAILADKNGVLKANAKQALLDGNGHSSKFTETQATQFLANEARQGSGLCICRKNKDLTPNVMTSLVRRLKGLLYKSECLPRL
jgi:hypothetical protein